MTLSFLIDPPEREIFIQVSAAAAATIVSPRADKETPEE
jgi:hypothetical protein